jgi:serine/threonine protein kinase
MTPVPTVVTESSMSNTPLTTAGAPEPSRSKIAPAIGTSQSTSLARSFSRARHGLRRKMWLWPLLALAVLSVAGYGLYATIERSLQRKLATDLQTILSADLAALDLWLKTQENSAADAAAEPFVQEAARELLESHKSIRTAAALINAPAQARVHEHMKSSFSRRGYIGCLIVGRDGTVLASFREELIGKNAKDLWPERDFVDIPLSGKPFVSRPMPSAALLPDKQGRLRSGVPTMFAAAPIRLGESTVDAVLLLRIPPEADFTRILNVARLGESGETYAIDRSGRMLSSSRFTEQIKQLGLIPNTEDADSLLTLQVRDPGVDLTQGERPSLEPKPLTFMAEDVTAGHEDYNVNGYRGYRGVLKVGAWRWLDKYQMGVATEVDRAEAYEALFILRTAFVILFVLLVAAAIGLLVAMLVLARVRLALRKATIETGKLGQYVLEEKLGEGGMGAVYKARHAFLRRPTAIKLLKPEYVSGDSIARFEREVQLTSTLNHPNTIAVYDYGRTAEGVFYYAMEYLDGIPLDALVKQYGPQPAARVVHILRQICGSLAEAHQAGLIHRDIKPANILVNCRAGLFDVVKVLDFGLVKSTQQHDVSLTAAAHIVGTPQYMSPEGISDAASVDTRSDLYAVGAVGYFLLTGRPVFEGPGIMDLCRQHMEETAQPPSRYSPGTVSRELDQAILRCLAKDKLNRPQNARELEEQLAGCPESTGWTSESAQHWWKQRTSAAPPKGTIQFEQPSGVQETMILQIAELSTLSIRSLR